MQLQDYTEYMGSAARVILVPSVRDAHHDFVFPQVCIFLSLLSYLLILLWVIWHLDNIDIVCISLKVFYHQLMQSWTCNDYDATTS